MDDRERLIKVISAVSVPLEILGGQISTIPYKELSAGLQAEILQAIRVVREVASEVDPPELTPISKETDLDVDDLIPG